MNFKILIINKIQLNLNQTHPSLFMDKLKNLKNSNDECNKDFNLCINYETCKGKQYRYKAKDDNGFCKTCVKNEKLKE